MKGEDSGLWTIHQLTARVAAALAVDTPGVPNGRVREIPDQRTIRYYTTIGLLDRPTAMQGRTALYGPRHLLQLLAIKRLQARGLSLLEVQRTLAGASDELLKQLAETGDEAPVPRGETRPASPKAPERTFWKSRPAEVDADERPPSAAASIGMRTLQAITLERQVTLLLDTQRSLGPDDLSALREAAAPLILYLREHQLIPQPVKGEDDGQAAPTDD